MTLPSVPATGPEVEAVPTTPPTSRPPWRVILREIIETILLTALIYIGVNLATGRFKVEGSSMEPSFHPEQYVLVDKVSYRLGAPQRGDVVVFQYPQATDRDFIKRIIGLPGETVDIHDGLVYVSGQSLEEPQQGVEQQCLGDGLAAHDALVGQARGEGRQRRHRRWIHRVSNRRAVDAQGVSKQRCDRRVWQSNAADRDAATAQDDVVVRSRHPLDLADEPGLADAGLAGDEEMSRRARRPTLDDGPRKLELV